MAEQGYDVAFLGGGTGAYQAAIRGAQLGLRVAVVEREKVGGTCLHRGCIPTKVMIYSASLLRQAQEGSEFGIKASGVTLDYPQVLKRKTAVVDGFWKNIELLFKRNQVALIQGNGQLTTPNVIRVEGPDGVQNVEARHVVIATGSAPKSLPDVPIDGERVISSDHAVNLPKLPKSIAVVGAGAVGVEFAYTYNAYGLDVTLIEGLPRIVPLEDAEVSQGLSRIYNKRGMKVMAGAQVQKVETTKKGVRVEVESDGKAQAVEAEQLLMAVGRRALSDGIGLEELGVHLSRGFIMVDANMATNVPGVYAIGDVIGNYLLAHVAAAEGIQAIEHIAGLEPAPLDYSSMPRVTYCVPEIGSVGLTEEEAEGTGRPLKVGKFPFAANSRAGVYGDRDGFVKMICDAETDELLGAHVFGPEAGELVHELVMAKFVEGTVEEVQRMVHAHPTLAEAVWEAGNAADDLAIHIYTGRRQKR